MSGDRFGPYELDGVIGQGGMGEVHRARDHEHGGRPVAVKVLPAALSADPQYRARFRREAEAAARLSDPRIPVIHRYGEIDGRLFLDMELVAGRELGALAREGLSPERAVQLVEQVAAALDCAHRAGLVHRDVKPSNVLVDETDAADPRVRLIDFGIAAPVDPGSRTALTRSGAVIGTLAYIAPERFQAHPVGPAVDVYALACVLHELLTGATPFPGGAVEVVVLAHLTRQPPRPSALRAGIPAGLDDVVARGMAKDPAARFPTAGALAAAARAALATAPGPAAAVPETVAPPVPVPVPAPPPPSPPPPRRPSRWLLPTGIGATAAALGVVVALVTGLGVAPTPAAAPVTAPALAPAAAQDEPEPPAGEVAPSPHPIVDRLFVGAAPDMTAVEYGVLGTTPVLLTNGESRVLDLATGEQLGRATGHNGTVAGSGADAVLLSSHAEQVVRVAELATGSPRPMTLAGHTGYISDIAAGAVDGRTVVASIASDATVRRWDLATGQPLGEPLAAENHGELRFMDIAGRPALVAFGEEATRVWDAATGAPIGTPIVVRRSQQDAPAVATVAGRPLVLATGDIGYPDITLVTHDLATGAPVGQTVIRSQDCCSPVTLAEVAGRGLVLRGEGHDVVQYDLTTGQEVGERYRGHEGDVSSLTAITTADGHPYLLTSSSEDGSVRVWDMTSRSPR